MRIVFQLSLFQCLISLNTFVVYFNTIKDMPTYTEHNLKKKEFHNLFMVTLAGGRYLRYSVCAFRALF